LWLRPRLRSTIFPYTTLFRSPQDGKVRPGDQDVDEPQAEAAGEQEGDQRRPGLAQPQQGRRQGVVDVGEGGRQGQHPDLARNLGDRKSTRLNSSHVKISYAVF